MNIRMHDPNTFVATGTDRITLPHPEASGVSRPAQDWTVRRAPGAYLMDLERALRDRIDGCGV